MIFDASFENEKEINMAFDESDQELDMDPLDERTDLFPVRSVDGVLAGPDGNVDLTESRDKAIEAQLKVLQESGAFDGEDGYTPIKGKDYFDGKDGKTPVKGVDYFDGKDGYTPVKGKDYFDGKDGISPTVGVSPIDGGYKITITDKDGSRTIDLMNGSKGDDGFSPDVNVTDIANGKKITITDARGATTFYLYDGEDGYTPEKGKDYTDGKDGVSPTVDITDIAGGHRITITDKDGTNSFDVMDGGGSGDMLSSVYDPQGKQKDIFAYVDMLADVAVAQFQEQFAVGDGENEISSITEWTQATSPSGFNQRQRSCCYGNGYYVIAGTAGQMVCSTDGVTWTFVTAFTSAVITGLAYGNGRFVAVDSTGNIYSSVLPTETWELVYQNPVIIESVRYLNNRFVAVGEGGFFATSLDAKSWSQYTVPTTNNLIDSAYGNGCFIAVGAGGTILRSINLADWFDCSLTGFGDIRTALFAGGGFVVGGASGNIAHSIDGSLWAMATNNTTSTVSWIRAFAYAEKRIYAVMYTSAGKGEIWISKDGGETWTVDKSVAGRLWCCVCGEGIFITSGDSGAIYVLDLDIDWADEVPSEGASVWHRYVATLSNGDKIMSESYKDEKPSYTADEIGARPSSWMPTASDIGLETENWTFTLEDGSTTTKKVYVG